MSEETKSVESAWELTDREFCACVMSAARRMNIPMAKEEKDGKFQFAFVDIQMGMRGIVGEPDTDKVKALKNTCIEFQKYLNIPIPPNPNQQNAPN